MSQEQDKNIKNSFFLWSGSLRRKRREDDLRSRGLGQKQLQTSVVHGCTRHNDGKVMLFLGAFSKERRRWLLTC